MYTSADYDKLKQIASKHPEYEPVISRILHSERESISLVTHEIRNPLTLIYSTLQTIESSHPEVHTFRHWDTLLADVRYTIQLLEELSLYNNGLTLQKKPVDAGSLLGQMVLSFAASTADSPVEFTSRIAPGLPSLNADETKLREAILNLLKNALEAFPAGSAGHIRLDADPVANPDSRSQSLRIQIRDDGCGIPPERMTEIFHPFVTYKSAGTGLGLPLSRRIIEAHGGTLTAESSPSRGSLFTILLPL